MMQWLLSHSPLLYFTQSLWRDEAFSILVAQRPVSFFTTQLGFEPPLYYFLLHYWLKIFGSSEIAARSLSLVGFALATIVVIVWAERLFKKHWLSWWLPLFFFLNPMLLYYAFEVRAYGWYVFWAVASMFSYWEKRWLWYVVTSVLGFYTHAYMLVILAVPPLHWAITSLPTIIRQRSLLNRKTLRAVTESPSFRSWLVILLLISPWLVKVGLEAGRLSESWYFPVNLKLVTSVLGNMFLGYEGTPWYGWRYTAWLSLILVFFFVLAVRPTKTFTRNLFFLLSVIIPLAIVVGISFVKPLFVNRYLIPVASAQVFLLALAIAAIKPPTLQRATAGVFLIFVVWFNLWFPTQHPKLPIRQTIAEINLLRRPSDVILVTSPLVFFETVYYSGSPQQVFLYSPQGVAFPWYVGNAIFTPSQMVRDLPPYPLRAFLVKEDGSYEVAYQMEMRLVKSKTTKPSRR